MKPKLKKLTLRMPPDDSRRFMRLEVQLRGHVCRVPSSSPDDVVWEVLRPRTSTVLVTDLSALGLFFVSQLQFDLGDQIWIELEIHGSSYPIRGIVVRQLAQLRGKKKTYGCGVQFLRSRFAPRAIAHILDYLSQRMSIERDNAAPRHVTLRAVLSQP